ncbi:MAG: 8-oxo-dGTP diphosphatase [Nanoarchaeota archaeon]|nr:8-oxo-dGTP diphosphatase [Nanoarchaeota archaeon]
MKLATLCYVKKGNKTLMLHRIKKEQDMHEGKWNGLGGKFEQGESPHECAIREIKEECGLDVINLNLKAIITFPKFSKDEDWYVYIYIIDDFSGELIKNCSEGNLEWIDNDKLLNLNLWEGDKIFLPLLDKHSFFSAKFTYKNKKLVAWKIEETIN